MSRRWLWTGLRLLGVTIYRLGLARAVMWTSRRHPKVLLYHACEAQESAWLAGLESNTPPALFERHLDFLVRHYTVVPLAALESGAPPVHAAVITFDDGYHSVLDAAMPALRARQLPATTFLIATVMDGASLVWVNELAWFLNTHPDLAIPITVRAFGAPATLSTTLLVDRVRAEYDATRVSTLLSDLRAACGPAAINTASPLYLTWEEVHRMAADGMTFGNHTASHPNLARLSDEMQEAELREGRETVLAQLGQCTGVAYPFGNHTAATRRLAMETGHRLVLDVGGVNAPLDVTRIARIPVTAATDAELFAEIEIIPRVKAALRRLTGR